MATPRLRDELGSLWTAVPGTPFVEDADGERFTRAWVENRRGVLVEDGVILSVSYAYTLRQSDHSNGADHYVVDRPLSFGRLHRSAGDALCRPRRKFWGLEPTSRTEATCKRCVEIATRLGLAATAGTGA